jgi:retron-type reverse transcriptase
MELSDVGWLSVATIISSPEDSVVTMEFAEDLDLHLAWRKTKRDFSHHMNCFVSTPYITEILGRHEDQWLSNLRERLASDTGDELDSATYEPRTSRVIDVPKSKYHIRPASVLYIEDVVVYSALMLLLYDDVRETISWSSESCRFSHVLYEDVGSDNRWQKFERERWQNMEDEKIRLAQEYEYVLETDVSGFYENIEIERVISVIRQMTGKTAVAMELWDLLATWAEPRKRGVPQGYGPSDILAEAYLDSIDRRLDNHGLEHLRFNDDFFVFCESRNAAINTQNLLEKCFRAKGLNMKTGKTEIRDASTALEDYEEPESIFQELRDQIEQSVDDEQSLSPHMDSPYGGASTPPASSEYGGSTEEVGEEDEATLNEDALEQAYRDHIEDSSFDDLERHLFRYIINHLGKVGSPIAVDYCQEYIREGRPDVRRIVYDYFNDLSNSETIADELAQDIVDDRLRYSYHEFVLIRWFFESGYNSPAILHAARNALNGERILEAREFAIAILGEYGDYSDWENIEMRYNQEHRPTTKAVMAYALRNFEPRHRDSFYDRIDHSHHITRRAIEAANEDT